MATLTEVRWNLSVILIRISLMAKDIEHFYVFIGHLYFLFEECMFISFVHLLIGLLFWGFIFWNL
jgi:hypothetical protein